MPGLLRGLARTALVAGTATAVSNRVSRRQAGRWASHDQQEPASPEQEPEQPEQEPAAPEQAAPGTGGSMDDMLAQLKQLGELKSQGVLSEAEFEQQKHRILGS